MTERHSLNPMIHLTLLDPYPLPASSSIPSQEQVTNSSPNPMPLQVRPQRVPHSDPSTRTTRDCITNTVIPSPLITLPSNTNSARTAVLTVRTSSNPTNPILQACVYGHGGCCTAAGTPGLRAAITRQHLSRFPCSSATKPAKSNGVRRAIERCRRRWAARKHTVSKTRVSTFSSSPPSPHPRPSLPMACQLVP